MPAIRRSPEWLKFYKSAFQKAAHQLLAWGYQDARHEIKGDQLEEHITGLIVKRILDRLDDPATPTKYSRYYVGEEDYVRESDEPGRDRQRIDIVVYCSKILPRPSFVFEAKLLRKNGFPIGLYAGDGGMKCFVRGEYASNNPSAAMIGYVQSDNFNRWISELKRVFANDVSGGLKTRSGLRKVQILPYLNGEWASRHERDDNDDIDIFHILLDCS